MRKINFYILFSVFFFMTFHGWAQPNDQEYLINTQVSITIRDNYFAVSNYFDEAYEIYPDIPRGILEAVSFTMTHFYHVDSSGEESCTGLPRVYGIMGLTLNGKNYFRNNLIKVSQLSGISISDIINSPKKNILAYAAAYITVRNQLNITSKKLEAQIPILVELSELPLNNDIKNNFALNSHLYSVLTFLNDTYYSSLCHFPIKNIDLKKVFGENNYNVLSSGQIIITDQSVKNTEGQTFINNSSSLGLKSSDYGPAIWNPADPSNYSSRSGTAISAVTIHTVQGSYAGCISWFQNPSANVSAHYVLRSSDGQVTQMVSEVDKAWHVGTENPYTIGYEHEGYVDDPSWYTTAMYTSSADLTRDVCNSGYGINPLRTGFWPWLASTYYNVSSIPGTCTRIKGHQHYPNQTHTDPGQNWNWDYYYKLVNNGTSTTTLTASSGNFYDTGGASTNYSDDERDIWVISPTGASTVTLNFSLFNIEDTWDYLYIYDGNSVWAPLIGYYTGVNSPGTIISTGGALTIEFRSDCGTNAAGWEANWTSTSPDNILPTTSVSTPNFWETADFTATFNDADNISVEKAFYQVLDFDGIFWGANANNGFFADNFDIMQPAWTSMTGVWNVSSGELIQSDESQTNSNIYASLNQNLSNRYLYHFTAKATGTGLNRRFGFHFFSDDASLPNRGNSYFIWFRIDEQSLEFYKVQNDVFTLENTINSVITNLNQYYDFKITYDRISGRIAVWRDNIYLGSWTDTSPYNTNGNFISFRTGECSLNINELKVYRSRYPNVTVTMGDNTKDIRFQNPNPTTFGAKIKSIVVDGNNNLSNIDYHDLNIDWTIPTCTTVNDGTGTDIDTTTSSTTLSANWVSSIDTNSGISNYWYAVGTTLGGTDVLNWTDNLLDTFVIDSSFVLTDGQEYYFSIKTVNGAGLESICNSNGVFADFQVDLDKQSAEFSEIKVFPNPTNSEVFVILNLKKNETFEILLMNALGKIIFIQLKTKYPKGISKTIIDTKKLGLAAGTYTLVIRGENESSSVHLVKLL